MKSKVKLKDVLDILSRRKVFIYKKFGVTDLAVFGSFAGNRQVESSDVDIYVELKKEYKTFDNFMDLKFYLEDLLESRKVDLVTRESIRKELQPRIYKEAVHV